MKERGRPSRLDPGSSLLAIRSSVSSLLSPLSSILVTRSSVPRRRKLPSPAPVVTRNAPLRSRPPCSPHVEGPEAQELLHPAGRDDRRDVSGRGDLDRRGHAAVRRGGLRGQFLRSQHVYAPPFPQHE